MFPLDVREIFSKLGAAEPYGMNWVMAERRTVGVVEKAGGWLPPRELPLDLI
jgi:hypothetical protein